MEAKKSQKADLEKKKGLFVEIGLVVVLAVSLAAFNIKSYDQVQKDVIQREASSEVEEQVIQTFTEETPPPPEPEVPDVVTEVTVVDNDAKIENELGIVDMSASKAENVQVTHVEIKEEEEVVEEEIFTVVEEQPEFPGGAAALYTYLKENIQYPEAARNANLTGKVYVSFVVEKDGSISKAVVMRDIGGGCGAEAVRVVKSMPKWKPGKQRGKAVRSSFMLPVNFSLR
ncbi:MAG: energy transducer TonB [Bacteroidales bacterium]|nr:energy transducer TonB [Bacteroidales bacterium]